MSHRRHRFIREDSGSSAVEFALAAPLFLAMLFMVVLGGWAIHGAVSVRYALEAVSRQLSLNPALSEADMRAAVDARVAYLGDPNVTVGVTMGEPNNGVKLAEATAVYLFKLDVPFLSELDLRYEAKVVVPLPA